MKNTIPLLLYFLAVILSGCSSTAITPDDSIVEPIPNLQEGNAQNTLSPIEIPTQATMIDPNLTPSPLVQSLIELSKADLASRLSINPANITVVKAIAVSWSDSSLGCPQEGMYYMQVLTPGFQIILKADEMEYSYHADLESDPFYCQNPSLPVPGGPVSE